MNRIFILVAILFLSSWDAAFAGCSLITKTPFIPGLPGIHLYAPIEFTISCNQGEDTSGTWTATTRSFYYGDVASVTGSGSQVSMALPPLGGEYWVFISGPHFAGYSDTLFIGKPPVGTSSASFVSCSTRRYDANDVIHEAVLRLDGLANADSEWPLSYRAEIVSQPPDAEANIGWIGGYNNNTYQLSGKRLGDYEVRLWAEGYPYSLPSPKFTFRVNLNEENCPGYDFSVESFRIGQSVFDPKASESATTITLVKDKPVMVRANIKAIKTSRENRIVPVSAKAVIDGQEVTFTGTFNASEIAEGASKEIDLFHEGAFSLSGSGTFTVEVNPAGGVGGHLPLPEIDRSNNTKQKNIYSAPSRPLLLDVYSIQPRCDSNCFAAPKADQSAFLEGLLKYAGGIFPTHSAQTVSGPGVIPIGGSTTRGAMGIISDLLELDFRAFHGRASSNSSVTRALGIASGYFNVASYFIWHGWEQVIGWQQFGTFLPSAISEEDQVIITAHEIAHSMGPKYAAIYKHYPTNVEHEGFWTELHALGEDGYRKNPSFMIPSPQPGSSDYWMDWTTYKQLYPLFTIPPAKAKLSSEVFYLSGMLSKTKGFVPSHALAREVSDLEVPSAGSGVVKLRDPNGALLSEAFFDASFSAEVISRSQGAIDIPLDEVPISFVAPMSDSLASIEVLAEGKVQAKLDPNGSLLKAAINGIPARGLLGDPESVRANLLSLARRAEEYLVGKSYKSARLYIESQLEPGIQAQVDDGIVEVIPSEYTKAEVLEVVARLLNRLDALKSIKPFPENGLIELKANKFEFGVGEKASMIARVLRKLSDPELEYHVQLELDGQAITVTKMGSIWRADSSSLSVGLHAVSGRVFVQNARLAKALSDSIRYQEVLILKLQRELEGEVDPDKIQSINKQIAESNAIIVDSRNRLISERKPVGGEIEILFAVN